MPMPFNVSININDAVMKMFLLFYKIFALNAFIIFFLQVLLSPTASGFGGCLLDQSIHMGTCHDIVMLSLPLGLTTATTINQSEFSFEKIS